MTGQRLVAERPEPCRPTLRQARPERLAPLSSTSTPFEILRDDMLVSTWSWVSHSPAGTTSSERTNSPSGSGIAMCILCCVSQDPMRSPRAHDVHGKISAFSGKGFLDLSVIFPRITTVALNQELIEPLLAGMDQPICLSSLGGTRRPKRAAFLSPALVQTRRPGRLCWRPGPGEVHAH